MESSPEPAQEEQTPDEPSIHPGWYAVAEEARLEEEIRPTPKMAPPRVSIMDFFPAVAPTGAEAAMLRAVTGQMPVIGDHKEDEESASTDEAVVSSLASAGSGDSANAEPTTANKRPAASDEMTSAMPRVEPAQAVAADSESTQVLPTLEEPPVPDETLVMATAEQVPAATQGAQKSSVREDASKEKAAQKETSAEGPGSSKAVEPPKSAESGEEKSENAPASKGSSKKGGSKKGSKKKGSGKKRKSKKK